MTSDTTFDFWETDTAIRAMRECDVTKQQIAAKWEAHEAFARIFDLLAKRTVVASHFSPIAEINSETL